MSQSKTYSDNLTPEQRKKNMRAIKSTGSGIERKLAKALWARGYRYRKNDKSIFGKPDLTFKKYKIAVFVDGEFWHGKDWNKNKTKPKTNKAFWKNKIEKNIQRDKDVNKLLKKDGWIILRFWGNSINKNLELCIDEIEKAINERKKENRI